MPPAERPQEEDGRVSKNDNRPVVVELVFALKKWEVVAHDGKETFKITGNIEMYWTDDRVIGFPTGHKPMPENMWRPRLTGCAGFDLGKAENYCTSSFPGSTVSTRPRNTNPRTDGWRRRFRST
jgi:hypothetical protein